MDKIKNIVFDVGGTLMTYKNMPNIWIEFYKSAFVFVKEKLDLEISDIDIEKSIEILRGYNPKVNYREKDISPEKIFTDATAHWSAEFKLSDVINTFFSSLKLEPYFFSESIQVLNKLKSDGYKIAVLTDVATGMPDELHKSYLTDLLPYFDLYVSSFSCGFRKPNPKGLIDIADYFGCNSDNIIFIGDEEKDIITAERFGCISVLINRTDNNTEFGQKYTVADLNEFYSLIKK